MPKKHQAPLVDQTELALRFLNYMAEKPEILSRFMGLTGVDGGALRQRIADPDLHSALLDFLMQDESLLLAFAADAGIAPQDIQRAHSQSFLI